MTDGNEFAYDIFLSYNRADEAWAARLHARLTKEKLKVFFAPESIDAGQSFVKKIEEALDNCRKLGVILTPEATESGWVGLERLGITVSAVARKDDLIIPFLLRDCEIPLLLSHIVRIDFRDESKFEEGFRKLLAVVRGELDLQQENDSTQMLAPIPPPPDVGFVERRNEQGEDLIEKIMTELAPGRNQRVALCGNGGLGKTTLAAEAVSRLREKFEDRIAWSGADGRNDYGILALLDDIASQMNRVDLRSLALEPKKEAVRALLAAKPALVVLDNFETISDAEKLNCISWLAQSASFSTLITTRERINRARHIFVDPMLTEEARDLTGKLIEQAQYPTAFEGLDRDRIIDTAEANPLIIEWIIGQIDAAQDYDEVLNDLLKGEGDAADRVFNRSFNLLTDDGRDALLALSMFAPNASRDALLEIAGFGSDRDRLNEAVKRLALLRLLTPLKGGHRLTVEGLTREFTKARLQNSGRDEEFRRRFVDHFLRLSVKHKERLPDNYDALETEKDNLVAAIETAFNLKDWHNVMKLVDTVALHTQSMMYVRGYWSEGITCGQQALESARHLQSETWIASLAHNLGVTYQNRGELEEARKLYDESLEITKKLGDQSGIASTLHQLGRLAQAQGELEEARKLYDESLEITKKLGNQSGIASTLHNLATIAQAQGELEEARKLYDESLEIAKKLGNQSGIAITLHQLAVLAQDQGELEEARKLYDESLEITKKLGDQRGIATRLHQLGRLAQDQGELEEARKLYDESLEIKKKLGNQSGIAITLHQLAMLAQDQGNTEEARKLYDESLEIKKKLGDQSGIASTLHQLGRLAEDEGRREEAAQLFREALIILEKLGSPNAKVARESLARVTD